MDNIKCVKRNPALKHNKMIRVGTISIEEFERIFKEYILKHLYEPKNKKERVMVLGESVCLNSDRYKTFIVNGYMCKVCGLKGSFFALEHDPKTSVCHLNLYGINEKGQEILMTKDHIIPRSKGGKDKIENYQTMCKVCNELKGNEYVG